MGKYPGKKEAGFWLEKIEGCQNIIEYCHFHEKPTESKLSQRPTMTSIKVTSSLQIDWECYETRQCPLVYDFVLFFGLDRAQNTIVVYY